MVQDVIHTPVVLYQKKPENDDGETDGHRNSDVYLHHRVNVPGFANYWDFKDIFGLLLFLVHK